MMSQKFRLYFTVSGKRSSKALGSDAKLKNQNGVNDTEFEDLDVAGHLKGIAVYFSR